MSPAGFEQFAFLHLGQQRSEEMIDFISGDDARAKLGQDRIVEAGISAFETKEILSFDASAYRICRLAISQPFHTLQHRDESQALRGFGSLPAYCTEVGEISILIDAAECITQLDGKTTFRKGGMCNTHSFVGSRRNSLG